MKKNCLRRSIFSIGFFWIVLQLISCTITTEKTVYGYVNKIEFDGKTIYQIFKHEEVCDGSMYSEGCDHENQKINLALEGDSIVCDPTMAINLQDIHIKSSYNFGKVYVNNSVYLVQHVSGLNEYEAIEVKGNVFSKKSFTVPIAGPIGYLRDFRLNLDSLNTTFVVGYYYQSSYYEESFPFNFETWSFGESSRLEKSYVKFPNSLDWEFTNRFKKCF